MNIVNKDEIDTFLWEHRENGCDGIKGELSDDEGYSVNVAWRDKVTGEEIEVHHECEHGKGITDYCRGCGRIHSA